MASISAMTRTVFLAPTARRAYLTRKAAAGAEARAMIRRKYPTEPSEPGYSGWHWSQDDRLCHVHKRLSRMIARRALGKEQP